MASLVDYSSLLTCDRLRPSPSSRATRASVLSFSHRLVDERTFPRRRLAKSQDFGANMVRARRAARLRDIAKQIQNETYHMMEQMRDDDIRSIQRKESLRFSLVRGLDSFTFVPLYCVRINLTPLPWALAALDFSLTVDPYY
jgi:hypothetical protein